MTCEPLDLVCLGQEGLGGIISTAANDALQELTQRTLETWGAIAASLGVAWIIVPTPTLVGDADGVATQTAGAGNLSTILGYVTWIGLFVAILALIGFAIMIAVQRRSEGTRTLGRLGSVLGGALLVGSAGAIVGGLLPLVAPSGNSSSVQFLQSNLWFLTGALAVVSVIVGGAKMAWEHRAQPGKDLVQALLTLIAVAGAGVVVINLALGWADDFSLWVLNQALDCDVTAEAVGDEATCFGRTVLTIVPITMASPVGVVGVLVLAIIALVIAFVQMALMIIRSAMLVLLAGILPVSASFTNTELGRTWFKRVIGWTIAFILYKPAAAIIYAVAFQLAGSDAFRSDGGGAWDIMLGLALMLVALVALPALMAFAVPAVSAVGGGGGGGLGMAAAGAAGGAASEVATGAVQRGSSSSQPAPYSSSSGGPTGSSTTPSAGPASAASAGGAGAGGAAAGGAASSGAAAGGGAAASGAAASGAAGAGAAAAGPAAPAVIGAQAVASGAKVAAGTVKSAVPDADGSQQ